MNTEDHIGYIYVPKKQERFAGGKVGDIYFPDEKTELFKLAQVGDIIVKNYKKPPYLVVDHVLDKLIITKWPGTLYKVEVLNPSEEKCINAGLVKNIWYTRTFAVKILEELPIEIIFGDNGVQIKKILDFITNISEEQVNQLATYDAEQNRKIYSEAWNIWDSSTDKESLNSSGDYEKVIQAFPKNQSRVSPIGQGLSIIYDIFYQTARKLTHDEALEIDEEGEIYLKPKWSIASTHCLNAGMSYEDSNLLTEDEKALLRKPFQEVFQLN
jgi:hypothetical protein